MFNRLLLSVSLLLAPVLSSLPIQANNDACIEPRNHFSGNTISNIQWSTDDDALYISTLGKIWKVELGNSPELLHSVCEETFPVIEVSEAHYAVGSDFLSVVLIYDIETDELLYQVEIASENTRSMAFSPSDENIALSTSNWDESGFFVIDRNVEVRNYRTGEVLAMLISDEDDTDSVFLPYRSRVSFVSDETILITGVDTQDSVNPPLAYVYLWNWRANAIEHLPAEYNAMVELVGLSNLANINPDNGESIRLQITDLLANERTYTTQDYNISLGNYFETELSSRANVPLLALENRAGHIWVINLDREQIIASRQLSRFATELAFDHVGEQVALGYTDGTIKLWDLQSNLVITIGNVFED